MDKHNVAVATMTWARDEEEERLLREAVTYLAEEKIPTFITDGGSGPDFVSFLRNLPGFQVFEAGVPGVFPQSRQSLRAAVDSGAEFILYTEPDKKLFFDGKLREFIAGAPAGDHVGVVLAARSEKSFATFPEFQRYTESAINRLCAEFVGEQADFTYGPFLVNRELTSYLDVLEDDVGWGWRPFIFAAAHNAGYRVVHLVDDFPCPPEQQGDNRAERIYRMRQLGQSINGLVVSTTISYKGKAAER